jgi:site-specific recombinase XerD
VDELLHLREYVNPRSKTRLPTLIGVGPGRVWQWVNDASREANVRAWPHLARHTFGTMVAESTDPAVWADLMNHSDLSQYRRYRGVRESSKREAVSAI